MIFKSLLKREKCPTYCPTEKKLRLIGNLPTMSQALSRSDIKESLLINKQRYQNGIVHIGLGNFHRAHFAVYTAKAMERSGGDWGICAFTFRNQELVEKLKKQENLYSVIELGPDTEAVYVPNSHTEFVAGYEFTQYISEKIADKSTKIVSLTITEAGYFIDPSTGDVNWSHPDVMNDLEDNQSRTIYGLITCGLELRNSEPLTILSCDNISHNGDLTKKLLRQFVEKKNPKLLKFFDQGLSFPNSMVDRIVPGTEIKHIRIAETRIGLIDLAPVPCEKFSMWALEDKFIAGRPDWPDVIFTDEVDSYEEMKLLLLNGSHSLLAYLGGLLNCQTIPDCRFNEKVELVLRKALEFEILPSVRFPKNLSANDYLAQLFNRWSNTVLGDRTSRVGSDGSTKLPQRITKPALALLNQGKEPRLLALMVAAWLACLAPFFGEKSNEVCENMKDPIKDQLNGLDKSSTLNFVNQFFNMANIFPESLASDNIFRNLVINYRQEIFSQGIEKTLDSALLST